MAAGSSTSSPSGSTRTTPPPKPPTCWPASASCSIRSSSTPSPTISAPKCRNLLARSASEGCQRYESSLAARHFQLRPLLCSLRDRARPLLTKPIVQALMRANVRTNEQPDVIDRRNRAASAHIRPTIGQDFAHDLLPQTVRAAAAALQQVIN